MKIALAGNPNSGKTTMYNALTGGNEKVGNWAGVTVERKERPVKKSFCKYAESITAVDLPGAYSMSPFTSEESITSEYIRTDAPDAMINIVDATNLSRSLFFTTQLLELGIPTVVALNKTDANEKKKNSIDVKLLSDMLGCPVVETVSTNGEGLDELMEVLASVIGKEQAAPYSAGKIDLDDRESVREADKRRYAFVNEIVRSVEIRSTFTKNRSFQDKIDAVITNKWVGLPIFALVMFLVFQTSQSWLGLWIAEGYDLPSGYHIWGLTDAIGWFGETVSVWMDGANEVLRAIVLGGIIEGVAAVLGFLPLVMVMYFLIALLEDCGYMARATVVLDPIFKKVGLSGRSVIPFIMGTGCAIPGVMACRTIRDERERRATAMLAPFMPCGAKLPLIALFVGAFFPSHGWIGTLTYFLGIAIILICAFIVNSITGNRRKRNFFIIELPEYKMPSFVRAAMAMLQRGWSYIVKAGTVILVCNFVIYMMQSFSWSFEMVSDPSESILASVAMPVSYFIAPIVGVAMWQLAAAAITGFIAKECVVSTLATCFAFEHLLGEELELVGGAGSIAGSMGISAAAALGFLFFNLFSPPCFAAIGAMRSEMKSKKWLFAGVGLQLAVGYIIGFLVFFFGTLFSGGELGEAWMPVLGWVIVGAVALTVVLLIVKRERQIRKEAVKN